MTAEDTIAALATPAGLGAVAIVRVSGPRSRRIARCLLGRLPRPRTAALARIRDAEGRHLDQGLALFFEAPHSYTGEDVLEIQGHGGPVVAQLVLDAVLAAGARLAEPGEFSRRAFSNGKLDLTQAEAVADLIAAQSAAAARAAAASLSGAFSARVEQLRARLDGLRVCIEAHLDFPDEDVDAIPEADLLDDLEALARHIDTLLSCAEQGALLSDGLRLVLAGPPNAGKSSLMNRLLDSDRAIVTAQPGTTRDALEERFAVDGLPLVLTDTAGLRQAPDEAEAAGIERTHRAVAAADQVLLVVDASRGEADAQLRQIDLSLDPAHTTLIRNKCDLTGEQPSIHTEPNGRYRLTLSALTGAGIDLLREHLKTLAGYRASEGQFSARRRHLVHLREVREVVERARSACRAEAGLEIIAEELRIARRELGAIVGEQTPDALLGEIFATFCIGK